MENNIELTVVIPAYNEAENLQVLLPRLVQILKKEGIVSEILVVDRIRPTDDTPEVCSSNGVVYLNRENSDSFGDAIRTGIAHATGQFVVFHDADGSHPPEFVAELYRFRNDYDVVVASRYVEGGATENDKSLILMSRALNLIYSLVLNIRCKDISNNFKLYRRELLSPLKLNCENFDIVEEILFKIVKVKPGARIKEVPFKFEKRKFGVTKRNLFSFILSFAVTLVKLRFGIKYSPNQTLEEDKRMELNGLATVVAAGLVASVLFHCIRARVTGFHFYPFNTFLFNPLDRFNDFLNICAATAGRDPFKSFVSVYPPFTYLAVIPFTMLTPSLALILLLNGFTLFVWEYVSRAVSAIAPEGRYLKTIALAFLTYPFLFVFDRANLEALVFIFLALFVHFHQKREDWKSVICLACAASMKIYPAVFLLLFIAEKNYKNVLRTVLLCAGLTLAGMLVLKGGVPASYSGFARNLAGFRLNYFLTPDGLQHNLSLFGTLRIAYGSFTGAPAFLEFWYSLAAMIFFFFVSLYVVFIEKELWRTVTAIVLYFLITPQVSFDYKLIHLLIPITLFLGRKGKTEGSIFFAAAFALLCIPKDYFLLYRDISVAVILNPLISLAILSVLFYQGLRGKRQERAA